ncbi:MAG TPA: hypothetical protein VGU64_09785, partial [Terriglobales bacterium]|nr:hypothetical protein [Terriglobales bacterium]
MRLCGYFVLMIMVALVSTPATAKSKARKGRTPAPDLAELDKMTARFAPTQLHVDTSKLSAGDRQALAKIIEAARTLNDVFMKQYWSGDTALYARLQRDKSALGKARLHYFWINKGPWSALDEFKAFLPGVPARKPEGANFYPEDMTKQEFEKWLASLSPEQQTAAKGFFTVIRWKSGSSPSAQRELRAIAYNDEHKDDLTRAAGLLKEAADLTDNASLKKFLGSRAEAFLSNDYYDSDMAWMDLDAPLDITIGPYEVYNDELFNYKAAFEAFINLRDDAETKKFSVLANHLQEIENNLPVDPQYRNSKLGAAAPTVVVDEIFSS